MAVGCGVAVSKATAAGIVSGGVAVDATATGGAGEGPGNGVSVAARPPHAAASNTNTVVSPTARDGRILGRPILRIDNIFNLNPVGD